jgi:hypothetical protein
MPAMRWYLKLCPKVGSLTGQSEMQLPLSPCAASEGDAEVFEEAPRVSYRESKVDLFDVSASIQSCPR